MAYWNENDSPSASRDTEKPLPPRSCDSPLPATTQPKSLLKRKRNIGVAILSGLTLAFWMAAQQERLKRQQTERENTAAATFWLEPHTLYVEIKQPVLAQTRTGNIYLKPGDFVWLRARSSRFAQINTTDGTEAVVPLSAIELAP